MLDYRSSHFIKWVIMWSLLHQPPTSATNCQYPVLPALVSSSNEISWQGWSISDSCCCNNATDSYLRDGHVKMFTTWGNTGQPDVRYYYQAPPLLTSLLISSASGGMSLHSSQGGVYIYIAQDMRDTIIPRLSSHYCKHSTVASILHSHWFTLMP